MDGQGTLLVIRLRLRVVYLVLLRAIARDGRRNQGADELGGHGTGQRARLDKTTQGAGRASEGNDSGLYTGQARATALCQGGIHARQVGTGNEQGGHGCG